MNKCEIQRSTWARGRNTDKVYLCGTNNMKCCLGFYMNQVDKIPVYKLNYHAPEDILEVDNVESDLIIEGTNSGFAEHAIYINDDDELSEIQREEQLKELFAENDTELKFVD